MAETLHGEKAKQAILSAGLELWRADPGKVSARAVAAKLGMTHAGVLYHFPGGVSALKDAIAAQAVKIGDIPVVRHLIVSGHPAVAGMDQATRQAYLAGC